MATTTVPAGAGSFIWKGKTYNPGDAVPDGFPVERFAQATVSAPAAANPGDVSVGTKRKKKGAK